MRKTAGKILSYHSASYVESEEGSIAGSSTATPVARNGGTRGRGAADGSGRAVPEQTLSFASARSGRVLSIVLLAGFVVTGWLSWFAVDANSYANNQLQTTVVKKRSSSGGTKHGSGPDSAIIQQRVMNVNAAVFEASGSQIAVWEPFLEHSVASTDEFVKIQMDFMSECFSREIYKLDRQASQSGAYRLQKVDTGQPPHRNHETSSSAAEASDRAASSSTNNPMAVFSSNFEQAAMEAFDNFHQGAMIVILRDPVEVYLEQRAAHEDHSERGDNLVVRQLSGMGGEDRAVNAGDYDDAVRALRSKFVIGSCDEPTETLRRLVMMISTHGSERIGGEGCARERQRWNRECRKMKEAGQRSRGDPSNQEALRDIAARHRFDLQLYEEAKGLFEEQRSLFGVIR